MRTETLRRIQNGNFGIVNKCKNKEVFMHTLIDDFAWIVITLVAVTLLFMVGAALILLDEGLRVIVRSLRKRVTAPYAPLQIVTSHFKTL